MKKTISIFGSTGSIGQNTVEIITQNKDKFSVLSLVAKSNIEILCKQAALLKPQYVAIEDKTKYSELKENLQKYQEIEVLSGKESIIDIAKIKCDLFVSAIVGSIGMMPTYMAIKSGSNIALANKESLVCAGNFFIKASKESGAKIIPIDSEHNAIFQIFEKDNLANIDRITLTASGGPFFFSDIDFKDITISQATNHPNWNMGAKISIDSATMMNKGLELIEAFYLFPVEIEQLDVLVHPQSIIHGMVNYNDGSTLAMLSEPDMKVPISYALNLPHRMKVNIKQLDLSQIQKLEFFAANHKKFPAINLCLDVLKLEGNMPTALNAANEVAVKSFLDKQITFNNIITIIKKTLDIVEHNNFNEIEEIIEFDKIVRSKAYNIIKNLS